MMLDKQLYERFENLLDNNDRDALKKALLSCQNEVLYDMARLYMNNNKKELDLELKMFKRFQKLFSKSIKDFISYQIGILAGIHMAIDFMTKTLVKNKDFEKEMEALYQKANVKDILVYLQEHPNAQHKTIVQDLNIAKNRLSQIMKELEREKCVLRYGVDRRCFYELTLDGQAFLSKKTRDNGSLDYTEKLLTGLWEKGRMLAINKYDTDGNTVEGRILDVYVPNICAKPDYRKARSKRPAKGLDPFGTVLEAIKIG